MRTAAPLALVRGAVDAASVAGWLDAIDAHPAWHRRGGAGDAFNVHSSSLRLTALPELDAATIATTLLRGETARFCRERLGDAPACDIDQCWVRRQYAPSLYPPGHAPHAWHQDGALAFDFLGEKMPPRADALLAMVTCWIALTPCGADAPGLELAVAEPAGLLPAAALSDAAVRAEHGEAGLERPVLDTGDCLAFGGALLHHTHVAPSMRRDRTSLEIRLFDSRRLPERLHGDRFTLVH